MKRFKASKWIMLSLAILANAFIIFYSSIDANTSNRMNNALTSLVARIINAFTKSEIEIVPVEGINARFSNEVEHAYNYIPGYSLEEIPLGSAKEIRSFVTPEDASNKSISYTASPSDAVVLNQSGSTLSVVGMKAETECTITAKSYDGDFESSIKVKVVNPIAPVSFEISLKDSYIPIGTTQTIEFDIDGGVLTHDELINFRYYDTRELDFSSYDEHIATVDENGVIYPHNVGDTKIKVSNGQIEKEIDIHVTSGLAPTLFKDLRIKGSVVCYANDMILDQSTKKHHHQLTPFDGEIELNPEDFVWSSSDELLVKVDKHGVMRGFRKTSSNDENAIITATSKATGQSVSFDVVVKNQLPSKMDFCVEVGDKPTWNPVVFTVSAGESVPVRFSLDTTSRSSDVIVSISDPEVFSYANEGNRIILYALKEGSCSVSFVFNLNTDLNAKVDFEVLEPGAINNENVDSFGSYLRKSVGHAAVFMVTQIFTFIAIYMFFYEKKWWFYSSISLGEGLLLAGLSELIQFFIPTRGGAWLDILIDFSGVLVGALLTFLVILLIKKIKSRKEHLSQE